MSAGGCSWPSVGLCSQQQLTSGRTGSDRKPLGGLGAEVTVSRAEAPSVQASDLVVSSSGANSEGRSVCVESK